MSVRPLIVMGTGGHASAVVDMAREAGRLVMGCVGPERPATAIECCPYLGDDDVLLTIERETVDVTVGVGSVGDAGLRRELLERVHRGGFRTPYLVHPRAYVAVSALLGEGVQVMAGAVVQSCARLGRNVIVNTGAIVEHHVEIGDHAHIAPGAVVCGGASIGAGAHVGANATVLQGLRIGPAAVVGAGAVVVRDLAAGSRAKGVPAA